LIVFSYHINTHDIDLSIENTTQQLVIVIAATNRPDALDPALRRAGRFDRELSLGIPDEDARERILYVLSRKLKLSNNIDFRYLAKRTAGYVGADLHALMKEAAVIAINRIFDEQLPFITTDLAKRTQVSFQLRSIQTPLTPAQLQPLCIEMIDFEDALKKVQPSSKREGFATIPDVSWDNVGALAQVREELMMVIVEPIKHPEKFRAVGITTPSGVLLCGPPGCGKTLLAKAVANESKANFISIKGPELLNKVTYSKTKRSFFSLLKTPLYYYKSMLVKVSEQ
jgi:ribosome biogenesis ATPase